MQRMQEYDDHNSEDEQHALDPRPEPMSRKESKAEEKMPRWANNTDVGRIGMSEREGEMPESMQPEWMRNPLKHEGVKFSIPPPITASLMLPPTSEGGRLNGQQSILNSIFGAFPTTTRRERPSTPSVGRNRTSRLGEEWTDIVRQERVLQGRIEGLLDLQASGLQRTGDAVSHSNNARESGSSVRSRSNLSESSMRSVSLRRSTTFKGRYPQKSKHALHTARMELLKAMYTLNDLAVAKEAVLAETSQNLEAAHKQLLTWQRKLSVADRNLLELETCHGVGDIEAAIDRQIRDVDVEISDLETRLKEANERRKKLLRKRVEGKSVKEAEAAKWVEVKREIGRDVGRWLRDPNVPSDMLDDKESYRNEHWNEFVKLIPRRRNLEDAVAGLAGAISGMNERRAGAQADIEGCERGTKLWSECLELIMKSEKALKEFLQRSMQGKENQAEAMLELMGDTERQLADKLHICSHEGWNLLVACLGAEVEAWREGVEVMGKMMGRIEQATQDARRELLHLEPSKISHSDEEGVRQRRHSGNTISTEDPMWGCGSDNDAQILEDPSSVLYSSSQGSKLLKTETIPVLAPTNETRPNQHSEGTEDDHVIHTEGLKISPNLSPWLNSSPKKEASSPDKEVSFRTAMEHSVLVDGEQDNADVQENETKGQEAAEMKREEEDEIEHEALTPREQRVPPHLRKGADMDVGEESDGGVPADLLG